MGLGISKREPDWSGWSKTWKAGGALETLSVRAVFKQTNKQQQKIKKDCCATPNSDILFSMIKVTLRKKTIWDGSESLWGDKESWNASARGFVMWQLLILIAHVAGPNLPFPSHRRADVACGGHQSFQVLRCGGLHLFCCDLAFFVCCLYCFCFACWSTPEATMFIRSFHLLLGPGYRVSPASDTKLFQPVLGTSHFIFYLS